MSSDHLNGARRRKQHRPTAIEVEADISSNSSDSEVLLERSPRSTKAQQLSPLPKRVKQQQHSKNWILEDPIVSVDLHNTTLPADCSSTWSPSKGVPPNLVDPNPVPVMAGMLQLKSKQKTRATLNGWSAQTRVRQVPQDAPPIPTAELDLLSGRRAEKENAGYVTGKG